MWSMNKTIRVLVVDDSVLARTMITQGLAKSPRIEIVGTAFNAVDALSKVAQVKPDVITSDIEMPGMNGMEFLKKLLPKYPLPVILVSSLNLRVFDALSAGAVDFVRKPDASQSTDAFINGLCQKVITAASARVRRPVPTPGAGMVLPTAAGTGAGAGASIAPPPPPSAAPLLGPRPVLDQVIIGLGASTGGTEATLEVMKRLPADIPGMLIVQHMPTGFTGMYAERLNRLCQMEVKEAAHGDVIRRGLALLAPADHQMRVVRSGSRYTVSCLPGGEKVSGHRPSVDALFLSMAEQVKCRMAGIIMTGMGRDGADGLLQMRKQGAYTIGQDKESCVVYGMPMVAYNIGAVQTQASCENIAGVLLRYLNQLT